MYINYSNASLMEAMNKAISSQDWEEYALLQEEADIRGI